MIKFHLQKALYSYALLICKETSSLRAAYYGVGLFANTEVSFAKQMRINDQVSLAKSPLLICKETSSFRAAYYGVGLFANDEVSFARWRRALCK